METLQRTIENKLLKLLDRSKENFYSAKARLSYRDITLWEGYQDKMSRAQSTITSCKPSKVQLVVEQGWSGRSIVPVVSLCIDGQQVYRHSHLFWNQEKIAEELVSIIDRGNVQ